MLYNWSLMKYHLPLGEVFMAPVWSSTTPCPLSSVTGHTPQKWPMVSFCDDNFSPWYLRLLSIGFSFVLLPRSFSDIIYNLTLFLTNCRYVPYFKTNECTVQCGILGIGSSCSGACQCKRLCRVHVRVHHSPCLGLFSCWGTYLHEHSYTCLCACS